MPIDRIRRDAAAKILAEFLRYELDRTTAREKLYALAEELDDSPVRDAGIDDAANCLDVAFYPVFSETGWRLLCRRLAFLKTDLEAILPEEIWEKVDSNAWDRRHARWHFLFLLAAGGAAWRLGWWIFPLAVWCSFFFYLKTLFAFEQRSAPGRKEQERQWLEFHPFKNQDQWEAYRDLLDAYELPPYDAIAFGNASPPQPVSRWRNIWVSVGVVTAILAQLIWIPLVISVSLLATIFTWPPMLLIKACWRPKRQTT